MSLEVQMEYTDLADLAAAFREGASGLRESLKIIAEIKALVTGGALHGATGNRLVYILDSKIVDKLKSGEEKFVAVAKEIESAITNMQKTDDTISHLF
jgi:hypothetical protein